jgi:hypothetical protein
MSVSFGKNKRITFPDFIRFDGNFSASFFHQLYPIVYFFFCLNRKTENNFIAIIKISDLSMGIFLEDVLRKKFLNFPIVFNTEFQTGSFANGFPDQGPSLINTWQTWDMLSGGWWQGPSIDPYHGGVLHTIAYYVNLYPNAVIRVRLAQPEPVQSA